MPITKDQIEHIAKLARLGITEEERNKYAIDLARILDYFQKLEQVDTEDIVSIAQITGLRDIIREDAIVVFDNQEEILRNSPDKKDKFLKVKSVL